MLLESCLCQLSAAAIAVGLASISHAAVVFDTDFEAGAPSAIGGAGAVVGTQGLSDDGFGSQLL